MITIISIIAAIFILAFILATIIVYACCVMAGRADDDAERRWRDYWNNE